MAGRGGPWRFSLLVPEDLKSKVMNFSMALHALHGEKL
jgi:hypothetical protein